MKYLSGKDFKFENTCVTFGEFEALHKGHISIIDKLLEIAKDTFTSVLLNFKYEEDLCNEKNILYTDEEKKHILEQKSLDIMIKYPIKVDLIDTKPETFIKEILIEKLGAKKIVISSQSKFGKDHIETFQILKELSYKYRYEIIDIDPVKEDGQVINTKKIRELLENGKLIEVNRMLGRPFTMHGEIVHGKALGRTVGMPTANLQVAKGKIMPKQGVYATISEINGKKVQGLTNIGQRPSVDNHSYVTIETFLFNFSRDIYGEKIILNIHAFIRGVQKFKCLDEVKAQVEKDTLSIKSYLDKIS